MIEHLDMFYILAINIRNKIKELNGKMVVLILLYFIANSKPMIINNFFEAVGKK